MSSWLERSQWSSQWSAWSIAITCTLLSAFAVFSWLKRTYAVNPEYCSRVRRRLAREVERRRQLAQRLAASADDGVVALSLPELVEQLQQGHLTAVQVLLAYQVKALEITKRYNCITEFIPDAEARAEALDLLPAAERGPLHGVPFSVKCNIFVAGMDSTAGLAKQLERPVTVTAPVVETLSRLGGVPFCRTNVPQTMMCYGCSNPVWGVTTNVVAPDRVPGGSSGGEGVLVAAGGSPFGVGTDIGGSARVPALFSGCYGFKPTAGRLSGDGLGSLLPATYGLRSTIGFLTRDVESVQLVMRLLTSPTDTADMYRLDPLVPRVLWNAEPDAGRRRWRIGVCHELPWLPVTPGVRRAVTEAADALSAAGHELVPVQPLEQPVEMLRLFFALAQPDNGHFMMRELAGEQIDGCISPLVAARRLPYWLARLLAWASQSKFRYLPLILTAGARDPVSAVETQHRWLQLAAGEMRRWQQLKLDLMLTPGFMMPAPPQRSIGRLTVAAFYSYMYNVLNCPAAAVPVSHVTAADQSALADYPDSHVELRLVKQATAGALGQPLGVQLAAPQWREELLLAGLAELQRVLGAPKGGAPQH